MGYVRRRWRNLLWDAAFTLAANVLFPRLSYRLRWSARVGPLGGLLYVLYRVGLVIGFFRLVAWLGRKQDRLRAEVREALGHEPTDDELFEYLMERG